MLTHIDFVHLTLKKHVKKGDHVVDATCGNGHDSALLASLALDKHNGQLTCIDIQKEAIASTKSRLGNTPRVQYILGSHTSLPRGVTTIVYNLGYLPNGDKSITTNLESTIASFTTALDVLSPGGLIVITVYPGHPKGEIESTGIKKWVNTLSRNKLNIFVYKDLFSSTKPYVYLLKKKRLNVS